MVSRANVEEQLKRIGCNFKFWGRGEIGELGAILMPNETIAQCVNGHYTGGFAMLCATDQRVLLIDHKPLMYLTIDDLRFDMITEFNYSHRLFDCTIHMYTQNKALIFTSWNKPRLRTLLSYVQQRVIEVRQHYYMAQQFAMAPPQQVQARPAYVPSYTSASTSNAAPQSTVQPVPAETSTRQSLAFAALRPKLGNYTYSKLRRSAWSRGGGNAPKDEQASAADTYNTMYTP